MASWLVFILAFGIMSKRTLRALFIVYWILICIDCRDQPYNLHYWVFILWAPVCELWCPVGNRRLGETYSLQGLTLQRETACSWVQLIDIFFWWVLLWFRPWRWNHYLPAKCLWTSTGLESVRSQKAAVGTDLHSPVFLNEPTVCSEYVGITHTLILMLVGT